jgi:hypothetical protein
MHVAPPSRTALARRPRLFRLLATLPVVTALALAHAPLALAAGDPPGQASPVKREQAQSRFERGKTLFTAKKYDEALVEFRASFDIVASPNTHLFVGRCLRELGRLVEAYVELGRTAIEAKELAAEDSRYARAAESATTERNEIAKKLGFISITLDHATDATTLKVAGEEVRRAGWSEPIPAVPGTVVVRVETPPGLPIERTVTLAAGARESLAIDVNDAPVAPGASPPVSTTKDSGPSGRSSLRTWAYVTGAVGVAGLVTFTVAGLSAHSTYSSLRTECGGAPCPPSRQSEIDSGRTKQTIANVGLIIGIVGVATGTTLFFLGGSAEKPTAPHTAISVGPGTIALQGSF